MIKFAKHKIFNMKSFAFLGEENKEVYFYNNKDLDDDFRTIRDTLKNCYTRSVKLRSMNREDIDFLRFQIHKAKDIIESKNFRKKYIDTTDIIEEDDRDNKDISDCSSIRKTTNHNAMGILTRNRVITTNARSSFINSNSNTNQKPLPKPKSNDDITKAIIRSNSFSNHHTDIHNEVIH